MRVILALLLLVLAGCAGNDTSYTVRGRVLEVRHTEAQVIVAHEAIGNYMPAMTMPFQAGDPAALAKVQEGDAISFRYTVAEDSSWITDIERLEGAELNLAEEPDYEEASDGSLYQMNSTWIDQDGARVRLASFEGKPVLVSMIFTHCSYACPMIIRDLKQVAAGLPQELQKDVRFVLISLDPDRDTPEAMTRFARTHGLEGDKWTILRGTSNDVRMIANLLGIRFKKEANGQFAHTNLITLLDDQGEIVHQQRGLGANSETTSSRLADLLARK